MTQRSRELDRDPLRVQALARSQAQWRAWRREVWRRRRRALSEFGLLVITLAVILVFLSAVLLALGIHPPLTTR